MTTKPNVSIVRLDDGREVCLSYGVPVAARLPATQVCRACGAPDCEHLEDETMPRTQIKGYIKTDRKYSVTTSRHTNQFTGPGATVVSDATLRRLILPVIGETR